MTDVIQDLEAAVAGVRVEEAPDGQRLLVPPDRILEALDLARQKGYTLFVDIGGVDHLGRSPRFDVVYLLRHPETADTVMMKVGVDEGETIPSATAVFKGADWPEREIYDLFGVVFDGHPNLKRILLPDDWEGHPLRRDYPLVGTEPPPPLATE